MFGRAIKWVGDTIFRTGADDDAVLHPDDDAVLHPDDDPGAVLDVDAALEPEAVLDVDAALEPEAVIDDDQVDDENHEMAHPPITKLRVENRGKKFVENSNFDWFKLCEMKNSVASSMKVDTMWVKEEVKAFVTKAVDCGKLKMEDGQYQKIPKGRHDDCKMPGARRCKCGNGNGK